MHRLCILKSKKGMNEKGAKITLSTIIREKGVDYDYIIILSFIPIFPFVRRYCMLVKLMLPQVVLADLVRIVFGR